MEEPVAYQAIKCALSQNWVEAIRLNLALIRDNTDDVEALNRLGYAYLKSGDINSSKSTYQKVLRIDKHNSIAQKILKWLSNLTENDIEQSTNHITPLPTVFLEEPGKTKIVNLVNTAPTKILCNLITAQQVFIVARKHSIEVRTDKNVYIGAFPDDLAFKLQKFLLHGNEYVLYIKAVSHNYVSVFIRELKRGRKFSTIPSFPVNSQHLVQNERINKPVDDNLTDTEPENAVTIPED